MRFNGFYGNNRTKTILSGMFDNRRIPNAILIDGPRGAGKKTLAGILAAAAVCQSDGEVPCGVCRQCRNAFAHAHPDIKLYGADGSTRTIGVDIVRQIRLDAYVKPNDASRKVYIIADAQNMTEQAQNALLKILEEPPIYVLFILTCDLRSHMLETIRSRSQMVSVGTVTDEEAVLALASDGITREDALRAAHISGGNIGRAKIMLSGGFSEISDFMSAFTKALCSTDLYSFIRLSGRLEKDSDLFNAFLELLPALFRDAISVRNGGKATLSGFDAEAAAISRSAPLKKIFNALNTALDSQKAADMYANVTLHVTALFSQLWRNFH
ncbi:DNA polymerase III subunit gamma and tau [[Clostridium] cellulosi]|uniref:DNA polymerase III subunit gamma and tau n=1 Tax=[Clostridium] cellulosi TaxID=29343 RepID=A0A078KK06_9FIRM|nr:DNA polymerase III subunit gamma and tau [[Clostridium] cellulosi]